MTCCDAAGAARTGAARARAQELALGAIESAPGRRFLRLAAPGMHCGGCVAAIERGLRKAPGVVFARANLSARTVAVEWREGETDAGAVAQAIAALGFETFPLAAEEAEDAEAARSRDLLRRMAVAGFAATNIMLLSVSVWSGAEGATRDLMHWISGAIALPVVIYSGRPFFVSALAGLRARRLNMDFPISLAVILAAAISLMETIRGGEEVYFDAAASLLFLLLIGRWLDGAMRARARSAAATLARLAPRGASVVEPDGTLSYRPVAALRPGDLLAVAPGERIAADGVIEEGRGALDRSHITGEAAPVPVEPGARVESGALSLDGALRIRASATGEDTTLAEIARLTAAAEDRKSAAARLADKAARLYVPIVHAVALATLIGWLMAGAGLREAGLTAVAVLIITCPCALGLAAPMAQAVASGALFRRGVMLKDGAALERLALIDRAVFDKTGVLTRGEPALRPPRGAALAALPRAAGLAARSSHPYAQALAAHARAQGVASAAARDVSEEAGRGVSGFLEGEPARLGSAAFVGVEATEDGGAASVVWFRRGAAAPVAYFFDDAPREAAAEALAALARGGIRVEALSGDREPAVRALAGRLGLTDWRAGATPQDKIARVEALSAQGAQTLMVGDGVNDAPALAAASVSMAPATATEIGRSAADIVFFGKALTAVSQTWALAKRTRAVILQNFGLAAAYNAIAIPLAVLGYASPLVAAVAMSASSLVVTLNALRLNFGGGT